MTYDGSPTLPVNAGTYDVDVTFTSNDPELSLDQHHQLDHDPPRDSVRGPRQRRAVGIHLQRQPQSVVGSAVGIDGVTPINGTFTYEYYNEYGSNTQLFGPPLPGAPTDAGYYTFIEYFTSQDPNYADGSFSWYLYDLSRLADGHRQRRAVHLQRLGSRGHRLRGGHRRRDAGRRQRDVRHLQRLHQRPESSPGPMRSSRNSPAATRITTARPAAARSSSTRRLPRSAASRRPTVNVGTSTVTAERPHRGRVRGPGRRRRGDHAQRRHPAGHGQLRRQFQHHVQHPGPGDGNLPHHLRVSRRCHALQRGRQRLASGTLTVQAAPSILTNPVSQTVVSGNSVTFSASASGYPAPTVQWQQSTNGSTYTNIAGATGASYTISAVTASQNGYRYRAVFTNSVGSATTAAATLTVQYAPTVTTNPSSTTVNAGQTATFTAAATGNPTPTVQWQVSTNGGSTFSNICRRHQHDPDALHDDGQPERLPFTTRCSPTASAPRRPPAATLTVRYAPIVSTNPDSQTVTAGQTVTFTAAATGNPTPTVQWQVSTNGGNTYTNISGATSTTYTSPATTTSQNGYRYRAVFTNSLGSATTTAAILTVI